MYQKPNAPLSIGGVLDDGFGLAKASFVQVFPLAVIGAIFSQLPGFIFDEATMPEDFSTTPLLVSMLVSLLGSILIFGALISKMNAVCNGQAQSISEALGVGLSCLIPLVFCSILYVLGIMGGMILLIIPGIILSISLVFGPYLVLTDGLGPVAALRHSHKLVWGDWWRTTIIFTVVIFVLIAAYMLIGVLGAFAGYADATGMASSTSFWDIILIVLISALVTPIFYAFALAVLNDLRLRKEGGDLADRLDAIDKA